MSDRKDFLVELGTEELPPKALKNLSNSFESSLKDGFKAANIQFDSMKAYAAPRRLAVLVSGLETRQPDKKVERRGPAVKAAFDADGNASRAAQGFAQSCGVTVEQLGRLKTDKGEWLNFEAEVAGKETSSLIPAMVEDALAKLPIPKRMRWGDRAAEFVRPVHWLVLMLGDDVIDADILELKSGNQTKGHRFHHPEAITINKPSEYAKVLLETGYVMADFDERRERIRQQVESTAETLGAQAVMEEGLLDEVTALVEWPVTLVGKFEERFLEVPQEALIYTMQDNQKYFPVVDSLGTLKPYFITVSNIESKDPQKVIEGNERVVRPRLADAAFFWDQDRKQPLETKLDALKKILFQNKLGTLHEKMQRVTLLASNIAGQIGADKRLAERAATLAKCDLMTDMVFEFSEMQGIAGRYYALHDGEPTDVAYAIEQHYLPKQAGDDLPESGVAQSLALADKLDTLAGIFGIGLKPTGTKDPFALRRAALGVLRIIIEGEIDLDLKALLEAAASQLGDKVESPTAIDECFDYILERLKAYYQDRGISVEVIDAVMAQRPSRPLDFDKRVRAVEAFRALPEAESLAAANKRIQNILKKTAVSGQQVDASKLIESAEQQLFEKVSQLKADVSPLFDAGEYEAALTALAVLRDPVDQFFDGVMVMADDEALKNNRLALLKELGDLFLRAADLSRLQ